MKPKRPFCKYALKISELHEDNKQKIDFKNLNKGFYDDLESKDKTIKEDKNLMNKIKKLSIKELIYSNKSIPYSWKNKFNYKDQVMNLISKDKKFLSFLGKSPPKNNFNEKLPNINNQMKLKSENNHIIENKYCFSKKKIKKTFKFKKKKELDSDEIKTILDDYRVAYPIDDNIYFSFNGNLIFDDNHPKEKNNSIDNRNKRNYIIKRKQNFRHNIFSFDSLNYNNNKDNSNIFNKNRLKNMNNEIMNKTLDKRFKRIKYYGPHFSFCPSCKDRNLEFYKNMEPKQCLKLINHLKNIRKNNILVKKKLKSFSSTISPNLSLNNDSEETETFESIENKNKN